MLRIGCVKYLNACPLIHGWEGEVDFDHPSVLCSKLAAAELDVALVSSFEFLRNPIYRIVDDVSISSDGPVYSVVVAHRGEIAQIEQIELDPASETSANLLRCLIAELGLNLRLVRGGAEVGSATALKMDRRAQLLIGDQAIRFRQQYANQFSFWDLGEYWRKCFRLPFVYALWLIRPEVVHPKRIAKRLRRLRDGNLHNLDDLIAEPVAGAANPGLRQGLNRQFLSRYYSENLRFSFGDKEKKGLRAFANLCVQHHLLPKEDYTLSVV